jgi:hypothetical protein
MGRGENTLMRTHRIAASAQISAPPARVYQLLADYREGHPRILPDQFSDLAVERGGRGAGTIIRFRLRLAGRSQLFRAAVGEPEPGRVLTETNLEGRMAITTFTVAPGSQRDTSHVTISTDVAVRRGLVGALQRVLTTAVLRPVYRAELQRLAAFAPKYRGDMAALV